MKVDLSVSIHNEFLFELRDAATGALKQQARAYNIVLNKMYDILKGLGFYSGNPCYHASRIDVGSGTGVLDPTRTTLFSSHGLKHLDTDTDCGVVERYYGHPTSYVTTKFVYQPSELIDKTITEVGLNAYYWNYGTAELGMVTHALLKDAAGNPISITKTATDVLIVYAKLYVTLEDAPLGGAWKWVTPAYNSLLRWLLKETNNNERALEDELRIITYAEPFVRTDALSKRFTKSTSIGRSWPASNGNTILTMPNQRLEVSDSNGAVRRVQIAYYNDVRYGLCSIIPPVPGLHDYQQVTDEQVGVGDGTTTKFDLDWNRVLDDGSFVLKVDGVPLTRDVDYTFDPNKYELVAGDKVNLVGASTWLTTADGRGKWIVYTDMSSVTYIHVAKADQAAGLTYVKKHDTGLANLQGIAISPDLNWLVLSRNSPYSLVVFPFNPVTGEIGAGVSFATTVPYYKIRFHPDGNHVVCSYSGQIDVYPFDKITGAVGARTQCLAATDLSTNSFDVSPDGNWIAYASGSGNTVYVRPFDRATGTLGAVAGSYGITSPRSCDFSEDGQYVAIAGNFTNRVGVLDFDTATGTLSNYRAAPNDVVTYEMRGVHFLPGSHYIAAAPTYNSGITATTNKICLYPFDPETGIIGNGFIHAGWNSDSGTFQIVHARDGNYVAVLYPISGQGVMTHMYDGARSNIVLASPLAANAVLTADYRVPYVPKDIDHMFDLQFAIQWGTPA